MKRVLIVSNNCFSKTNSNGRTLGNLLYTYEKDKIAQFYISGAEDVSFCENYYNVTDYDVIHSVFPLVRKKYSKIADISYNSNLNKRNVPNMLMRNFAWNLGLWKNKKIKKWLNDFKPEVIVLQVGDCEFMLRFVLWLKKHFNVPVFLYISETYYFKKNNYFNDGHDKLYKLFISRYKRTFNKLYSKIDGSVFLCDAIKDLYDSHFGRFGIVIYNSSSIEPAVINYGNKITKLSYLGNLSLNRYISLCKIADTISNLGLDVVVNIYGCADATIIEEFSKHKNIKYNGFVDYNCVQEVIRHTDILLHAEAFDDFYLEDTKYGFSGKIADSLNSGKVFFLYAPKSFACTRYLLQNGAGIVATEEKELEEKLKLLLTGKIDFNDCVKKELYIAKANHDLRKNSTRFMDYINREEET